MADMSKKQEDIAPEDATEEATEQAVQNEESGEFGISHVLVQNEEDIEEARKRSGYHYSHDELDHKEDHIGKDESE